MGPLAQGVCDCSECERASIIAMVSKSANTDGDSSEISRRKTCAAVLGAKERVAKYVVTF